MDAENEIKKRVNPFYCNICKIWCSSALNLQSHFLGAKHKRVEEALKAHVETESCLDKELKTPAKLPDFVKTESCLGKKMKTPAKLPDFVPLESEKFYGAEKLNVQTLEDHLNRCKDSEPALGLNYIVEYRRKDNVPFFYECQLCYYKTGLSSMFMHVCGSRHRLAYLRQHYPEIAQSDEVKGKGSELSKKVRQVGLTIEKKEGRKQMQVVIGVPKVRRKRPEFLTAEDSPSEAKVQHVDEPFSNAEQTDNKDGELTDPAQVFRAEDSPSEVKVQHEDEPFSNAEQTDNKDGELTDPTQDENNVQKENEERQKEQAKLDETVEPNNAIESSEGNNSERCETDKQSEDENKEAQQEFTANPEEFTSQEELLGYLQNFEILNEDDASFILKVTQTLTNALVEYRQQAASNKDHLDAGYNGETALEYSTEQPGLTSADIIDSDTDYSSSLSAKQFLPVNEDEPQDFSTGSLEMAYEKNITTEFLNSVRNMNAEEVTDTLHKIAASNPAFRGIDIPNVIKILTESGTLRGPSDGSTQ